MTDFTQIPMPGTGKVAESMIFKTIWITRSRRSFLTGIWLREFHPGHPFWFNLFAHVLPKAMNKYPYFRFYYKNIILLTPGEHALMDQGTEEARISYALELEERTNGKNTADWAKIKALEEELKVEYGKYFPTRRGLIIGYKYSLTEQLEIVGMLNKKYLESLKKV